MLEHDKAMVPAVVTSFCYISALAFLVSASALPMTSASAFVFVAACLNLIGTVAFLFCQDGISSNYIRGSVSAYNALCLAGSLILLQSFPNDITWGLLLVAFVSFMLSAISEILMFSSVDKNDDKEEQEKQRLFPPDLETSVTINDDNNDDNNKDESNESNESNEDGSSSSSSEDDEFVSLP